MAVCPIAPAHQEFAENVHRELTRRDFYVDLDSSRESLKKKVRKAQVAQYNYILVIGDDEVEKQQVNVRLRDGTIKGTMPLDLLVHELQG